MAPIYMRHATYRDSYNPPLQQEWYKYVVEPPMDPSFYQRTFSDNAYSFLDNLYRDGAAAWRSYLDSTKNAQGGYGDIMDWDVMIPRDKRR